MSLPKNKTNIVCTIGPATETPEVMVEIIRAGMNVARRSLRLVIGDIRESALNRALAFNPLRHEGKAGNKEKYDPRSVMKLREAGLAERVKQAVTERRGLGTTLFGCAR